MFKPFDKRQLLLITIFIITILLYEDLKSIGQIAKILMLLAIPIALYNLFPKAVGIIGYIFSIIIIFISISKSDPIGIAFVALLAVAIGTKYYSIDKLYDLAIKNKFNSVILLLLILTAISTTVIAFKL